MTNEQLRSVPLPLKTGEFIPRKRSAFWLDRLVPLAEEGRVLRTPCTFVDIQARLTSEAGTMLPEELAQRFGFADLDFVELVHPDSKPIVFAGYEKDGKDIVGKPLNEAVAIIDLNRSDGMGWSGWAGKFSNRLLPADITISGVDKKIKRVLVLRYDAFYNLTESLDIRQQNSVEFSIGKINFSVSEEDGFEFKSGFYGLRTIPYQYLSDYTAGVVTKAMIAKTATDVSPKHKNSVYLDRYARYLGIDGEITYLALYQGIQNSPNDFYCATVSSDKVKLGRENTWEIEIPRKLPQPTQTFDFLNIAS